MKKKILIALILVLALSVSVMAGCNLSVMSIELVSGSFASEYYVGDTVSLSKAKIKVTNSDGTTKNVDVTQEMLDKAISTATVGETEYTITYEGKTTTFKIKVVKPTVSITPNTVNCYVGDEINLSDITVTVTKGGQPSNVALTQAMLGGQTISTATAGKFTYDVTCEGVTVTLTVNVTAPTIAMDTESAFKDTYFVGETLNLTGAKLKVTKGTSTVSVDVTADMIAETIAPLTKGSTTYTVKYLGATTTFTVTARQVESISLVNASLELIKGQPVPYNDIKLTVKYEDIEATEEISASEAMFGDNKIDVNTPVENASYTITYMGKTATLTVSVIDPPVESIAVKTINTTYHIGDKVDLTNAVLTVNFEGNQASSEIPITEEMFGSTPITTSQLGEETYTISFGGKTTTTTITVKDIKIILGDFITTYNYRAAVSNNNTIKVVDATDTTEVLATLSVTNDMLDKPISTQTAGTTQYTITYIKAGSIVRTLKVTVTVNAMQLTVQGLTLSYEYNATPVYNGKIIVRYEGSDEIAREVNITSDMFDKPISTTTAGDTEYTLTYEDVAVKVTIHVNPEKKPTVNTFEMPQFIQNYYTKSATTDATDADFKIGGALYEVGNVNKFIVEPHIIGLDVDGITELDLYTGVHTTAKVEVKATLNGTYRELTADELAQYVTISGNSYKFDEGLSAVGLYVRLTISLDGNYYEIPNGVTSSRPIEFVVVDKGYNVYDQNGLAVMNDYVKPELWADILGCTVANGQYVAGSNPLQLEADDKPLYQYIGDVEWVIIHGHTDSSLDYDTDINSYDVSIKISPDNLPAGYFWNGNEKDYSKWYTEVGYSSGEIAQQRQALMLGSLRDADIDGTNKSYIIVKNPTDNNNNKGLYNTTKVKISGNYNTIKIVEGTQEYTADNGTKYTRKLIGVAHRHSDEADRRKEVGNQWHLFSMMEPLNEDNGWSGEPVTNFVIKNLALTGNTGHTENLVYAGIPMLRFFAKEVKLDNIVANKFHINFTQDNYASVCDNKIVIANTKVYDTFNSMTFAWRGQIDITNSVLKDCGGPLFIMADGDSYTEENKRPIVNVDSDSYLESYAMGTEAWYQELNSAVTAKFGELQVANEGMKTLFSKSFWTERTVNNQTNNYTSLVAIIIPETGTAFGDIQWATSGHVVRGEYNLAVSNGSKDTFAMEDEILLGIIEKRDTNVFKSGNNYACQYSLRTIGDKTQDLLVSPELYKALIDKEDEDDINMGNGVMISAAAAYFNSEPVQNEFKDWCDSWATTSSDILGLWMQGVQGAKYSPYIGIVFSNFKTVASN